VYSARDNLCVPCPDYHYTVDSLTCKPQPYPVRVKNYNNRYLILELSQPVKYPRTVKAEEVVKLLITNP
jgi:hypothetical protein